MVRACAVRDCQNNLKTKVLLNKPHLLFHRFPSEGTPVWHKWVAFCRKGREWTPSVSACICSDHFKRREYSDKITPLRRVLLKNAVPTIPVRKQDSVCKDDLIRIHMRNMKQRKGNAPSDVESLLENYFNGVMGEEVDEELRPINEEITEELHEDCDEEDDPFHEIIRNSFTDARICDSNKARQIASEVLSSKSDVQMLVVVTPEDLQTYNQSIKLENKLSLNALNSSSRYKVNDIMKTGAGTSIATRVGNNSTDTLPNKLFVQHKENLSDKRLVKQYQSPVKSRTQQPFLVVQAKPSLKYNGSQFNPKVKNQTGNSIPNKVTIYPKVNKEFSNNAKIVDYLDFNELDSGTSNTNIPFTEMTNTKEVMTSNDDSSPQSSPNKSVRQHAESHLSSVIDDASLGEEDCIFTLDEEDLDFPENVTNQSPSKQVNIVKCITSQSGKSLFFQPDDNDLKILNSDDAYYAYAMSPSSDFRECDVPDDFSNSSMTSNNNEEQLQEELESDEEENAEEVEANYCEKIEIGDVMQKEQHHVRAELASPKKLASVKKNDKLSSVETRLNLSVASVDNNEENNKSAEDRVKILEQRLKEKDMEIRKLKGELFEISAPHKNFNHVTHVLKNNFSGFMRELALHEYEYRLKPHSSKGIRYPDEIRTFAKTVYLQSASMYRYMRTLFKLPNPSNLRQSLKAFKDSVKTDDKAELIRLIHGTDFSEEFEGDHDNELREEVDRNRPIIIEIPENESGEEMNENEPAAGMTENQRTAEMIKNELTQEMPDNEPMEGVIENDTRVVSSQLLNLIENCEFYFEDESGNPIPSDAEQIIEYVGAATKIVEEIDADGQKRYVLVQVNDEGNTELCNAGQETNLEPSSSVEARNSQKRKVNTTGSQKRPVGAKKPKVEQAAYVYSSDNIGESIDPEISEELLRMNIIVKEEIVSSEQ